MATFGCTESNAWPAIDAIWAALNGIGAVSAAGDDKNPQQDHIVGVGVAWLAVSGLFAVYTAHFGSYDKSWGSLSAVIVMLTWLWLSALALLFGGEIDAQIERGLMKNGRIPG